MSTIRIQSEAFDTGAELRALRETRRVIGAVVCFEGVCRDSHPEQGTASAAAQVMELEHYPGMAEISMAAMVAEAQSRWCDFPTMLEPPKAVRGSQRHRCWGLARQAPTRPRPAGRVAGGAGGVGEHWRREAAADRRQGSQAAPAAVSRRGRKPPSPTAAGAGHLGSRCGVQPQVEDPTAARSAQGSRRSGVPRACAGDGPSPRKRALERVARKARRSVDCGRPARKTRRAALAAERSESLVVGASTRRPTRPKQLFLTVHCRSCLARLLVRRSKSDNKDTVKMKDIEHPTDKAKRHDTPEQLVARQRQAEHARAAAAASGISPRQARLNKLSASLLLVYRWQFTSPGMLDKHVQGRPGLARDLIRAQLLDEHPVPGPGRMLDLPASVVTLAPQGIEWVEPALDEPLEYAADVPWHQLRHDLAVQRMTLGALRAGKITGYRTPAEIAGKSLRGRKQPDAVWLLSSGDRTAFELELTVKKGREFDETCRAIIEALDRRAPDSYDRFVLASPSRAILDRYRQAFRVGSSIPTWERNVQRQWRQAASSLRVPDWTAGRIILQEVAL